MTRRNQIAGAAMALVLVAAIGIGLTSRQDGSTAAPGALDTQTLNTLRASANSEQAAVLADGTVTREEYEASAGRTMACMSAAGAQLGPVERGPNSQSTFSWVAANAQENVRLRTAYDGCYRAHQRDIDVAWSAANRPASGTGQAGDAFAATVTCLRNAGFDVASGANAQAVSKVLQAAATAGGDENLAASTCLQKTASQYGRPF